MTVVEAVVVAVLVVVPSEISCARANDIIISSKLMSERRLRCTIVMMKNERLVEMSGWMDGWMDRGWITAREKVINETKKNTGEEGGCP